MKGYNVFMIMFIKKKNLILLASVFMLLLMFTRLFLQVLPTNAQITSSKKLCIVLDPGHGGADGGAVGASGTKEEALNLEVALLLEKLLKEDGADVIMTRRTHEDLQDDSAKTVREKKVSDMHNREKIMNESGADIFISIHMNKFTDSRYNGPQVFYSQNCEESKLLAEHIQKSMISVLKPSKEREIKKAENTIYLMKKAKPIAVLVECGFLSNAEEESLLNTDEYRQKIAESIFGGIKNFINQNKQ